MDNLKRTAELLNFSPENLVEHIVRGAIQTRDPETRKKLTASVWKRYVDFGILPDYITKYCFAVLAGTGRQVD